MIKYNQNSRFITVFHGFQELDEAVSFAGYSALIQAHDLKTPMPDYLCVIGKRHKKYDLDRWHIFTPRHRPDDTLFGHLTFALKYEGIDLSVLNALFQRIEAEEIRSIILSEPTGRYSRKLWFLWEWLRGDQLDIEDARKGNFVPLVNGKLQYEGKSYPSKRHRVHNNLPGTHNFCPLIRKTKTLEQFTGKGLSKKTIENISQTHPDLIGRAAAFLLLQDSKASYTIEGEAPPHNRIVRWGKIIGEAGQRKLNIPELERLQQIVIEDYRFTKPGLREEGGFIGQHDRSSGMPIPDHISARPDDLATLLTGLIKTYELLCQDDFDVVLTAAMIAFGFVFIHPFEDGNGRIHRYLFHHVLAENDFVPKGLVFPVSAVILGRIDEYRKILEHFSQPRLDLIDWRSTERNNVEVLNETMDLYRYFDATKQAEFLFECVAETINKTLPDEVGFLKRYDLLNNFIKSYIDMPDNQVDLLIRFLTNNAGKLSNRAKKKEFEKLTDQEIQAIEGKYSEIFN
ncbi:MAG: Fic family protein [Deltaproteobacteria bacterium]|nr:Fic family protein [Deltaproteobacteria bacterium]MBT4088756.1 Fic family protein [Deltaproteobacteria bacterium]MBT4266458.1 Fic family protein [Deltaproteobacteria bacterium]MBT4644136.1 Fic family protein [Deltaproteobacteria bacterium]MBT6614574.1 Fic family protein [Deltaproteobacteria bacterium]